MNTIELTEEEYKALLDAVHYLIDEFYEEEVGLLWVGSEVATGND